VSIAQLFDAYALVQAEQQEQAQEVARARRRAGSVRVDLDGRGRVADVAGPLQPTEQ